MTVVLIGLVAIAVIAGVHAVLIAPRDVRLTFLDAPIPGLSQQFDGYTISVIADLHHWGTGTNHLRRIVGMSNDARPDLIALLGDYGVSFEHSRSLSARAYRQAFPAVVSAFRNLQAPDGCVAILGNHDHYHDGNEVAGWLRSMGARVLINEHVVLHRNGARLVIGGVGDACEDRVDPMGGVGEQPSGTAIVVLSHNPDAIELLDGRAGIGLVLAGHTHGGQIVIPFYGALATHTRVCGRKTASGWIRNARAPLFVTRGVGAQTPIRFRCPPELLVVRLRVADQQPA